MEQIQPATTKNRSHPFLERFKNKIIKVDRFAGLNGALGAVPHRPIQDLPKSKSQTRKSKPLTDPQCSKRQKEQQNAVEVNRFATEGDELSQAYKQNLDSNVLKSIWEDRKGEKVRNSINCSGVGGRNFSRIGKWKLCLDLDENEEVAESRLTQMKDIILPKIESIRSYASESGSRIKQKIQQKNRILLLNPCLPKNMPKKIKIR